MLTKLDIAMLLSEERNFAKFASKICFWTSCISAFRLFQYFCGCLRLTEDLRNRTQHASLLAVQLPVAWCKFVPQRSAKPGATDMAALSANYLGTPREHPVFSALDPSPGSTPRFWPAQCGTQVDQ